MKIDRFGRTHTGGAPGFEVKPKRKLFLKYGVRSSLFVVFLANDYQNYENNKKFLLFFSGKIDAFCRIYSFLITSNKWYIVP